MSSHLSKLSCYTYEEKSHILHFLPIDWIFVDRRIVLEDKGGKNPVPVYAQAFGLVKSSTQSKLICTCQNLENPNYRP